MSYSSSSYLLLNDTAQKPTTIRRYIFYYVVSVLFVIVLITTFEFPDKIELLRNNNNGNNNNQSRVQTQSKPNVYGRRPNIEKPKVSDTLDGIGYRFQDNTPAPLDPRYEVLERLQLCKLDEDKLPSKIDISKLVNKFQECINPIVSKWMNNSAAINGRWEETAVCDYIFNVIDIVPMENLHEIKWTILPTCKEENIMVTLGVGHDTSAEEKLNMTLPNTTFFGADPIIEPNRQLYSAFGKFFPFAIGRKPGFTKFRVLPNQNQKTRKYQFQEVTTIPFSYFLSDILGLKKIDFAWIDIEGGEFEFLDQLHRGEVLDQKGVSICQFNLEVHSKFHPPGAVVFHDFVFRVLQEKRYVFLKPTRTNSAVHRMFFINVEDKRCIRKFLQ